ncbi:asparagine synthase-related protein, partial [Acinetobacter baumannii]
IPTYLVSKLTRNHVTVSLSGDAGDELFCGYNRYLVAQKVWNKLNHFPIYLRKELAQVLINISPTMWDRMFKKLPILNKYSNIGDK